MTDVLVLGSVNHDITVRVRRFPRPGETLLGSGVSYGLGGKGANQAVASASTGVRTALLATVGDDSAGRQLVVWLAERGVDVGRVAVAALPSGTAHIVVDDAGENQIVVVQGANVATTGEAADAAVLVLQGEIPVEAIGRAIRTAGDALVVLNLAPFIRLSADLLTRVDVLVVNESEAAELLGRTAPESVDEALVALAELAEVSRAAVVTLGARGAVWSDGQQHGHVAATATEVVDTTGAGDAFVGVLAAALATGRSLGDAVQDGVRAATESVRWPGAGMGYPAFVLGDSQA